MYATIDSIQHGDAPWESFSFHFMGPLARDDPQWKRATYTVYCRNTQTVVHNMLNNKEFDGKFDYIPFQEYTGPQKRRVSNLMSGDWVYQKANEIAADQNTHGSMVVPIIGGSDKTTVSVATGHQEFHPFYLSLGNIDNSLRRAHRDAILPVAFLSIPKVSRDAEDTEEFRLFRKQLYHMSITRVLKPLRAGMSTPEVVYCPDGHIRHAVYQLGPYIADYPEQVVLSGIVSGWCPKCLSPPEKLDTAGRPRTHDHTHFLWGREGFSDETIWTGWGIDSGVIPFTMRFPRADIHELLTPDLLHQMIKGTFKDHLVLWVEQYIYATHSKAKANQIMGDIDRRITSVPSFPGLRRFPEGRRFQQWTGNDSKGFMKVYLSAIEGYVPD
ncbi:hypothetical protein QCA50_020437 [Cerrena zonata]|uniref:Uncharacterized protein n=1 Tax=Cerrena zonata TaxID=2478898 RepID=A0AAW0FGE3_9APHY